MSVANAHTPELAAAIRAVLSALEKEGDYCVLRNFEELPDYTRHDLDILVRPGRLAVTALAVREACLSAGWGLLAEEQGFHVHSLYFFNPQSDGSILYLPVDLADDLPWGWMATCRTGRVLSGKRCLRGISVASPGAEAALRLIKEITRGRVPGTGAIDRIRSGLQSDGPGFEACFEGILDARVVADMARATPGGDAASLRDLSGSVRASIARRAHLRHPLRQIGRLCSYLAARRRAARCGALGAFVVMIGPDGTGKTTLGGRLAAGPGREVFRGAENFHSQFGHVPRLRALARRATGKELEEQDFTLKHSGSEQRPHHPLRTLGYLLYYSWDYLLGRFTVRHLKARGRIVIFDRYFYDYYYQRASLRMPWRVLDLFRALAPCPDVVLLLVADPERVYARKPELDRTEIERQLTAAERLVARLGSRVKVVRVRTDRGEEAAEREAVAGILDAVSQRNHAKQSPQDGEPE